MTSLAEVQAQGVLRALSLEGAVHLAVIRTVTEDQKLWVSPVRVTSELVGGIEHSWVNPTRAEVALAGSVRDWLVCGAALGRRRLAAVASCLRLGETITVLVKIESVEEPASPLTRASLFVRAALVEPTSGLVAGTVGHVVTSDELSMPMAALC